MSINLTDEIEVKTKKGKLAAAKQIFLEGDKETVQQIGEKTHQLENAVKDITATGGASTANAVSYSNETSGMTAVTAQGAIDELVAKNKTQDATIAAKAEKTDVQSSVSELKVKDTVQDTEIAKKANAADVTSQMQTEQTRVNAELDKKFNKEDIAQDFGESKDKVVSQFALPFREIESPEFIKVIVDANDHLLFSINLDGEVDWGKGIPAPIRAKLQDIINQMQQNNKNITDTIYSIKEYLKLNLNGKVISILGDSLSTYSGYIPTVNATYYPSSNNDIGAVEQTWWMQLITESNAILGTNNSYSGAKVSGNEDSSYTKRATNLGNPDYIIIHGGTNDIWQNVTVGSLHFELAEESLNINEFADSYDLLVRKCKSLYPYANIILVIPHVVSAEYTTVINEIAKHYNLFGVVDLHNCSFVLSNGHYQVVDMSTVAEVVAKTLYVNKNVLYEEGKSLTPDEINNSFEVIENDEFIHAMQDAEGRILFGIYRATGKPYYPLNEMYHVEQNEEYFALWLDAADHVLLGIRRDGQIIGEIHAVNTLKLVIAQLQSDLTSLQEKVGTIDTSLQELLSVFSLQDTPEYLAVETDADGKVLSATNADGSHYIHNAKSETIPEEFVHIEDPDGRTEITTDAEGKVMSYRDSEGKKHEHSMDVTNLDVSNLNLEGNSVNNIQEALKANGFDVKHPMDWSTKNELQIPEPYCAFVNITGSFPTSKGDTTKGEIQFYDMQGNYFKKFIEMDIHGRTSSMYKKKNYTFDFYNDADYSDAFTIKFGDWVSMDSFYFQGWYSDAFRGIDIIEYKLYQQMISTRGFLKDKPYKYSIWQNVTSKGNEDSEKLDNNLEKNALCTPMGFPVIMYLNGEFWGIYTIMLKKNRANFRMDKKNYKSVMLDLDNGNIVSGIKNWKSFEIRNPKVLICMDGSKYNGDAPKELIDESSEKYDASNKDMVNTVLTKNAIVSLADSYNKVKELDSSSKSSDEIRTTIEKYYNVDYIIDYIIFSNLIQNVDGWGGNWQWTTWDGVKWNPNPYDLNASLGLDPYGLIATSPVERVSSGAIAAYVYKYYMTEIKDRYKYLKNSKIISIDNIIGLFYSWIKRIGTDNYANEFKKWNSTPSQRKSYLNSEYWDVSEGPKTTGYYPAYSDSVSYSKGQVVRYNSGFYQSIIDNNIGNVLTDSTKWKTMLYDENTTYEIGDELICTSAIVVKFKCIKSCIGQKPVTKEYDENFGILGFYDSIGRIYKWFEEKITYLDSIWNI